MKEWKLAVKVYFVFSLTLLSTISQAAERFSGNVVRIGILTDMSGVFSENTGAGSIAAARLAIEDYGSKVRGRPIELISADHGNKPDIASARAREWIDRDGVDVIADLINSSVALAVLKVASEKNRITIVTGSGTTRITNEDCSPTNLHWAYDTYATANATARALIADGKDTWFFITADYAFGHSTEKDATAIVKAAGGRVLGSVRHPVNVSDFGSQLLQAQASGAKVIAFANAGADTVNAVKQAAEFGIAGNQSLVGLIMVINDIRGLGLKAAQGMYLAESFYWDSDDETRAFSKRFYDLRNRMPNMTQAAMYSAVTHYLRAVDEMDTDDTEIVMAAMRRRPINDMFARGGSIRADGLMVHDMSLFQVKSPDQSRGDWDVYELRKVVPGHEAFAPLSASRCATLGQR